MAVTVKVTVKGKIEDVMAAVKTEAAKQGMKFSGDASSGSIESQDKSIAADYSVSGQVITINVTKKPLYLIDPVVKKLITDWFAGK